MLNSDTDKRNKKVISLMSVAKTVSLILNYRTGPRSLTRPKKSRPSQLSNGWKSTTGFSLGPQMPVALNGLLRACRSSSCDLKRTSSPALMQQG